MKRRRRKPDRTLIALLVLALLALAYIWHENRSTPRTVAASEGIARPPTPITYETTITRLNNYLTARG